MSKLDDDSREVTQDIVDRFHLDPIKWFDVIFWPIKRILSLIFNHS
jgi:hypothetical protein